MKTTYTHNALRSICKVNKLKKRSSASLFNLWERLDYFGGGQIKFREELARIDKILRTRGVNPLILKNL